MADLPNDIDSGHDSPNIKTAIDEKDRVYLPQVTWSDICEKIKIKKIDIKNVKFNTSKSTGDAENATFIMSGQGFVVKLARDTGGLTLSDGANVYFDDQGNGFTTSEELDKAYHKFTNIAKSRGYEIERLGYPFVMSPDKNDLHKPRGFNLYYRLKERTFRQDGETLTIDDGRVCTANDFITNTTYEPDGKIHLGAYCTIQKKKTELLF